MRRLDSPILYEIGAGIHPLTKLWKEDGASLFDKLTGGKRAVDKLLSDTILPLPLSREEAEKLQRVIDERLVAFFGKPTDAQSSAGLSALPESMNAKVRDEAVSFETVLNAELAKLDCFVPSKLAIYDMSAIIGEAESVFSSDVREILSPQALKDFSQAGRCLAFELPTAAAFHLLRAV